MSAEMQIALAFVDRINAHDVEGLCELMMEDHRFIEQRATRVECSFREDHHHR